MAHRIGDAHPRPHGKELKVAAAEMTLDGRRAFLTEGTRTALLATTREDGRPHAAPIAFRLVRVASTRIVALERVGEQ